MDDEGNLASFTRAPGSVFRPFDRDGARAVASLVAQVGEGNGLYIERNAGVKDFL